MYTDPCVINNFNDPVIIKYNYDTSSYNKYLFDNPNYKSYIVGLKTVNIEQSFFDNKIKPNIFSENLYIITNQTNDSNIIYVGKYEQLDIILSNDKIINNLITNPKIISKSNANLNIVTNWMIHPIINSIYICFNKLSNIETFNQYSKINNINNILINITNNQNYNTLCRILTESKTTCVKILIYESIILYNNVKKLKLPGYGFDISKLIANNYQVQLFDNTNDFEEIFNLVDSSRINKINPLFIDNCYQKLYENIKFNNLDKIFISLPNNLIINNFNVL